ncbi:MAG: hypothetical protein JF610_02495 [Acidobacteria bacterium]|nr:hypothetical protein [Acidobacteriota bacterium]
MSDTIVGATFGFGAGCGCGVGVGDAGVVEPPQETLPISAAATSDANAQARMGKRLGINVYL